MSLSCPLTGEVKKGFMNGLVTKDEYAQALRAYQKSNDDMKNEMRDKGTELYQNSQAELQRFKFFVIDNGRDVL